MLTRLAALTVASVLLASSIAVAAPRVQLTSDDQVDTQGQAPVYVPTPEDYHRFDHQN
jgi:hypothetical protein